MNAESWERLQRLFEAAAELAPREREAFLARECRGDDDLRAEVESLLRHDRPAGDFISGVVGRVAELPRVFGEVDLVGRRVGNYRVLGKLGEGGMGEIYEAEQSAPVRRRVALKLIKPGLAGRDVVARFESERQTLALMDHPAIARIYDAGLAPDGRPWFAMEYVEGRTIVAYCDERRLDTRRRLELFVEVCRAVQHAHHKGIIHRDIKPSNVLVQEIDGRPLPKIIDFGVAKVVSRGPSDPGPATQVGMLIGTPEYMSPEQARTDAPDPDTRSDVYSLGVLLYELLVGERPFDRDGRRPADVDELRRRIREDVPSRPSVKLRSSVATSSENARRRCTDLPALIRELRGDLDWITMKALEKDRERRYDSPAELAADIRRHLEDRPVVAGPPGALYRTGKFIRRHKMGVTAASVVLIALLLGASGVAVGLVRAVRAEAEARREADSYQRISRFLVELFEVSDPGEARGNEITAREILDRGAARIAAELRDRPDVRSTLMDTMGSVYRSLGLYTDAGPLIERALSTRRELFGGRDPSVAESLTSLGVLRHAEGRYEEAEKLFREALGILEEQGPRFDEQRSDVLDHLAECLRVRGDYGAAEPLCREALTIRSSILGEEHPKVAESLTRLGVLLRDMGDLDAAETLVRRALELRERLFGELHPDVAATVEELAFILQERDDHDAAETLFRRGLDLDRRLYGEDHPHVATALYNLASLLHNRGRSAEAETLFRRVLEMDRRQLGDEHLYVTLSMNNLAGALRAQGKLEEAERLYRRALAMQRRIVGPQHPEIATTLSNLAAVLRDRRENARAEGLLREALEMRRSLLGDDHPHVAVCLSHLAGAVQAQGRFDEAEALYREALSLRRATLGPEHSKTATTMIGLASLLRATGRLDEAVSMYREALQIKRASLRPGHPDLAHPLLGLGRALAERRDLDEAETALREALAIRDAALGQEHWATAEAEIELGELLSRRDRPSEGERLLRHGRRVMAETFGEEDARTRRAAEGLAALARSGPSR